MSAAFSYKITTENEQFTFDFTPVLGTSETLTAATCVVEVKEGTDPSPNSIKVGTATISGSKAAQRIYNGLDGVIYRLEMTVTTSLGNVYTLVGDLPVIAPLKV